MPGNTIIYSVPLNVVFFFSRCMLQNTISHPYRRVICPHSNFIKGNEITSRVRSALSSPHCWFRFYARSPEPLRLSILLSILSYSIMQPRCYGAATTARACCRLRGLCGGALGSTGWHARACRKRPIAALAHDGARSLLAVA